MDSCLPPDWNTTDVDAAELPLHCQRRPLGLDNELVELLWQNGEVVLQSQNHKKPNLGDSNNKFKHTSRDPNQNTNQEDETISWIQCPIAEAFEKEFCSKFLSDIPSSNPVQAQNSFNFGPSNANPVLPSSRQPDFGLNSLPPPRFSSFDGPRHENRNMGEIAEIVDPLKKQRSMGQCSAVTMGSSHCGSNQVANDLDMSRASSCGIGGNNNPWRDGTEKEMLDQPIASSSGGSGSSSLWKTSNQSNDSSRHKRKSMEESECRSDGTESESAPGNKSFHKSGTARRSRVAEVHNLSERRRRDRINEKMKALQELIPNSNKSDKASVLDEAIEYMKSLQLQLQFMWMGRGMAPMILPGMQHYMSRLGFGIGPPAIPQIQDLMRLSRFPPMVNQVMRPVTTAPTATQGMVGQTHMLNPVNYQNQMQNPCFPEQYANYMGFNSTQNTSQPMNMFNFGSHSGNNHSSARPNNGNGFIG